MKHSTMKTYLCAVYDGKQILVWSWYGHNMREARRKFATCSGVILQTICVGVLKGALEELQKKQELKLRFSVKDLSQCIPFYEWIPMDRVTQLFE